MPTTRRSNGPAQKGTQRTLSFNNSTKITKASTPSTLTTKNSLTNPPSLNPSKLSPEIKDITTATEESTPSSAPRPSQTRAKPLTAEQAQQNELASQISDAKIRKYWKGREELRLAPRVHQKDLDISEKILREWDVMSQYGPAIGITRTKRWHRAFKLGLNPPIEILAVLLKEEEKKNTAVERAYIDELMGTKEVIGGDAV